MLCATDRYIGRNCRLVNDVANQPPMVPGGCYDMLNLPIELFWPGHEHAVVALGGLHRHAARGP